MRECREQPWQERTHLLMLEVVELAQNAMDIGSLQGDAHRILHQAVAKANRIALNGDTAGESPTRHGTLEAVYDLQALFRGAEKVAEHAGIQVLAHHCAERLVGADQWLDVPEEANDA